MALINRTVDIWMLNNSDVAEKKVVCFTAAPPMITMLFSRLHCILGSNQGMNSLNIDTCTYTTSVLSPHTLPYTNTFTPTHTTPSHTLTHKRCQLINYCTRWLERFPGMLHLPLCPVCLLLLPLQSGCWPWFCISYAFHLLFSAVASNEPPKVGVGV